MEDGDETRQRALLVRGMQGVDEKGRILPKRLRALNVCGNQGGERGGDPPPRSARPRRAARDQGGTPRHNSAHP